METRNVTLTLEKAKEFYNSGNAALKEVALQAFTKEELRTPKCGPIIVFSDAVRALGLSPQDVQNDINRLAQVEGGLGAHLVAVFKLDIIRKALNMGWEASLVEGKVYYPYVRAYPAGKDTRGAVSSNCWKLGESFLADGRKYTLVGGDCGYCCYDGLADFGCAGGGVLPDLGLLGCKSKEIAQHMSKYFSKEIFEATYASHKGIYMWV